LDQKIILSNLKLEYVTIIYASLYIIRYLKKLHYALNVLFNMYMCCAMIIIINKNI